jgi:hypothetical protein
MHGDCPYSFYIPEAPFPRGVVPAERRPRSSPSLRPVVDTGPSPLPVAVPVAVAVEVPVAVAEAIPVAVVEEERAAIRIERADDGIEPASDMRAEESPSEAEDVNDPSSSLRASPSDMASDAPPTEDTPAAETDTAEEAEEAEADAAPRRRGDLAEAAATTTDGEAEPPRAEDDDGAIFSLFNLPPLRPRADRGDELKEGGEKQATSREPWKQIL